MNKCERNVLPAGGVLKKESKQVSFDEITAVRLHHMRVMMGCCVRREYEFFVTRFIICWIHIIISYSDIPHIQKELVVGSEFSFIEFINIPLSYVKCISECSLNMFS